MSSVEVQSLNINAIEVETVQRKTGQNEMGLNSGKAITMHQSIKVKSKGDTVCMSTLPLPNSSQYFVPFTGVSLLSYLFYKKN